MKKGRNTMAAKFTAESFNKITFTEMAEFIQKNHPEDKAWFKEIAYQDKDGDTVEYLNKKGELVKKYNHLNAKRRFCERYAPELLPTPSEKKGKVSSILEDW